MDHVVLTGDLVSSRRHGETATDAALATLQQAAADFGRMHGVDPRFTRFRGDGWQVLLGRDSLLFDAVVFLLLRLRASDTGVETRIGVGIGPVTSPGSADLADAAGPAFNRSGEALETLPVRHLIAISGARHPAEAALGPLIDCIAQSWTAPQAEAMALALEHPDWRQADIAEHLGITRQAVQLRLAGAGAAYLRVALAEFASGGDSL